MEKGKLNSNFSKYLDSLNGQFLHKRVENIFLDNVFVSPFLRTTEEKTDKNKLENLMVYFKKTIIKLLLLEKKALVKQQF